MENKSPYPITKFMLHAIILVSGFYFTIYYGIAAAVSLTDTILAIAGKI